MSARFCFKYYVKDGGHFIGSFKARDGDEYTVAMTSSYNYNRSSYPSGSLTIEWKKKSNKLIKVLAISEQNRNKMINKTMFIDNEVRAAIQYNSNDPLSGGNNLLVIEIDSCPCIHEQPVAKPGDKKLTATKEEPIVEKKLEKLSTDIKNFLQTGELSDVVLTDGSKEIRAHKFILCSRSSVFAKMFQHPTKENRENRITIKDISHEVMKALLDFMYSWIALIKDSTMARDLYVAADKYDVQDLRDICTRMLMSVNVNSVLDTLLFADLYRDKMLKKAALDFISNNYSQMKATAKWSSFMKEHLNLAVEILSLVIDNRL